MKLERRPAVLPALPRGPVLDWSSWRRVKSAAEPNVAELRHVANTTSGRAALYQALRQVALPAGSGVLLPTYHCPTMVAPVLLAGLRPRYFGLQADGLPALDRIGEGDVASSRVMLVPHYFGVPRSLAIVRAWCDTRGIVLIEDCAHCYFGTAGARAVGAWGDFAIASLSKFFPVAEGGLLASAHRPIAPLRLARAGLRQQAKGWVDVFETASRHGRPAGIGKALEAAFGLKNPRDRAAAAAPPRTPDSADDYMRECDMGRIDQAPTWASRVLDATLPRGRVLLNRQRNHARLAGRFASVPGARPLFPAQPTPVGPYVFPLWLDDGAMADTLYARARAHRLPVFRWDRRWPGTPELADDAGRLWNRHVLQLLCHQDLSEADVDQVADRLIGWAAELASAPRLRHAVTA